MQRTFALALAFALCACAAGRQRLDSTRRYEPSAFSVPMNPAKTYGPSAVYVLNPADRTAR